MGKETLQTLAEVKMHVCDEHLAHKEMKNRLKRRFGMVDPSLVPGEQDRSRFHPFPTHANDLSNTSSTSCEPPDTPLNSDSSNITGGLEAEGETADGQPPPLLSTIIDQFVRQGEMDRAEPDHSTTSQIAKVSLEDLFDFSRFDWLPHHQRTGKHSLNEEMEIYDLLDADLPGQEGAEVGIDETTGDILTLTT